MGMFSKLGQFLNGETKEDNSELVQKDIIPGKPLPRELQGKDGDGPLYFAFVDKGGMSMNDAKIVLEAIYEKHPKEVEALQGKPQQEVYEALEKLREESFGHGLAA